MLARAYNELGRHADARAACDRVLCVFSANDLAFPGLTLLVESERLVAEAGLGRAERARSGLARLLDLHGPKRGPLTLAELHEAGVRIAMLCGDRAAAFEHCEEMTRWHENTGIPSLIQHSGAIRARMRAAHELRSDRARPLPMLHAGAGTTSLTGAHLVSDMESLPLSALTQRALRALVEQHRARQGYLYWIEDGACRHAASLADAGLDTEVDRWLREHVVKELADTTSTTATSGEMATPGTRDLFVIGSRYYRLLLLFIQARRVSTDYWARRSSRTTSRHPPAGPASFLKQWPISCSAACIARRKTPVRRLPEPCARR